MITTEFEPYCQECPYFDANVIKIEIESSYMRVGCNTRITCKEKDKCDLMYEYLKKKNKKENKDPEVKTGVSYSG